MKMPQQKQKVRIKQQNKQRLEDMQKLKTFIKSNQHLQKPLEALVNSIESQITTLQKKMKEIPEPITLEDNIQLLSNCQKDIDQSLSPQDNLYSREIPTILHQIQKHLDQIKNSVQLHETSKVEELEQQLQINQDQNQQHINPALKIICETHLKEIIFLNLSKTELEQKKPFLCIDCIQEYFAENKNVSNIIDLYNANERWKKYLEEQDEQRIQRQTRFNQVIEIIQKLQEKYNQQLSKINESLFNQLIKEPENYGKLLKLKNNSLFQQDKQHLLFIIKILVEQKNKEKIQNEEDFEVYKNQTKLLEELMKENLVVEDQLQQNYDQQLIKLNDISKDTIENEETVTDSHQRTTILDEYLSFFQNLFNSLKTLNNLKQKGKLDKFLESEPEIQYSQSVQIYQRLYKQLQDIQDKLESLVKIDEIDYKLIDIEQEKQQILLQGEENKKMIQSTYLSLAVDSEINKHQIQELIEEYISELKQEDLMKKMNWQKGDKNIKV